VSSIRIGSPASALAEARDDLLGVHLEREEEDAGPAPGDMMRDREPQAGLPDRRARGDDRQIPAGEALRVRVDLAEARRDPAHLERVLHPLGDVVVVLHQRGLDMPQLRVDRVVAQAEDPLLRPVEGQCHIRRLVVGVRRDVLRRIQEAAEERAIPDDAGVALDVHRGRRRVDELAEVCRAADLVEQLVPRELDLHRQRVDALAALEQRLRRAVHALVLRLVEVVGPEQVRHLEDRVAIDEQRAEDALLRDEVVRDGSLGRLLQRHSDS